MVDCQGGTSEMNYYDPYPETGAASAYGHGWRQLWKYFFILFIIGIIVLLIGAVSTFYDVMRDFGFRMADDHSVLSVFGVALGAWSALVSIVYGLLVMNPVNYGVKYVNLKAARNERVNVGDLFKAFSNYWNAVLAPVLVGILVGIGFVMLIVPGIILACKFAFTPYLLVDRRMNAIDAMQESWRMTNGHVWTLILMGLMSIPIFIMGLLCFGVGVIVSIMWTKLAFASLYYAVSGDDKAYEPSYRYAT
jgi:hypothetical protein